MDLIKKVEEKLSEMDVFLYHISWKKKSGNKVLRIIVDIPDEIINMEKIIKISKFLSKYFDKFEPTSDNYNLEVLSAGIERELYNLKHWQNSLNKLVYVVFKTPVNSIQKIYGIVIKIEDELITIQTNDTNQKKYKIELNNIKKANWMFMGDYNVR